VGAVQVQRRQVAQRRARTDVRERRAQDQPVVAVAARPAVDPREHAVEEPAADVAVQDGARYPREELLAGGQPAVVGQRLLDVSRPVHRGSLVERGRRQGASPGPCGQRTGLDDLGGPEAWEATHT
jgi:hypothetical protein